MASLFNLTPNIIPYNLSLLQDIDVDSINGSPYNPFNGVVANTNYPLIYDSATGILSQAPITQNVNTTSDVNFNSVNIASGQTYKINNVALNIPNQAVDTTSNVQFNSIKCNLILAQGPTQNTVKIGGAGGTAGQPLTGYNYVRVTTTATTSGGGGFAFMTGNDGYRGNVGADGGFIYFQADASTSQGLYFAASGLCRLASAYNLVEFYVGLARRGTVSTTLMDMLVPITSNGKITGLSLQSPTHIFTGAGTGIGSIVYPNTTTSYTLTLPSGLPSVAGAPLISSLTGTLSYNNQALLTTSDVNFNNITGLTLQSATHKFTGAGTGIASIVMSNTSTSYTLTLPTSLPSVAGSPLVSSLTGQLSYGTQAVSTTSNVNFNTIRSQLLLAPSIASPTVKIGGAGTLSGFDLTGYNYVRITTSPTNDSGGGLAFIGGNDTYYGNIGADGGWVYITADVSAGQGVYLSASGDCRLASAYSLVEFYVGFSRRGIITQSLMDMLIPIQSNSTITGSIINNYLVYAKWVYGSQPSLLTSANIITPITNPGYRYISYEINLPENSNWVNQGGVFGATTYGFTAGTPRLRVPFNGMYSISTAIDIPVYTFVFPNNYTYYQSLMNAFISKNANNNNDLDGAGCIVSGTLNNTSPPYTARTINLSCNVYLTTNDYICIGLYSEITIPATVLGPRSTLNISLVQRM